jgi:hypothetical protein
MKFLSLTILSSLFLVASAYGETPLTQEDKEHLVGDYRFEGHYKQSRNIVVELTISLDENGDLIGTQRDKNDKSRGQWWHKTYTNYRRLAPKLWRTDMKFKNTVNDHVETSNFCFLWCSLFGPIYLAAKGIWSHAFVLMIGGIVLGATVFFPWSFWIVYAFFAKKIVRNSYLKKGWVEAADGYDPWEW